MGSSHVISLRHRPPAWVTADGVTEQRLAIRISILRLCLMPPLLLYRCHFPPPSRQTELYLCHFHSLYQHLHLCHFSLSLPFPESLWQFCRVRPIATAYSDCFA